MQGLQVLPGVVCLDKEAGGGFELLEGLLLFYCDFPDRGEPPFFAFRGDGDGVPWPLALVLLPEASFAVDQVDLLEVELELVLMHGHKQVVGLGGATDQSPVGDLLDTVALGAGHGVYLTAKV